MKIKGKRKRWPGSDESTAKRSLEDPILDLPLGKKTIDHLHHWIALLMRSSFVKQFVICWYVVNIAPIIENCVLS